MMTPLELKQSTFLATVAIFLEELYDKNYQVTIGEGWRSPETCEVYAKEGKGILHSNHELRLAQDLVLFKNDIMLPWTVAAYLEAGEIWEELTGPGGYQCCWGGRFTSRPDCDHFSFEHNGVR